MTEPTITASFTRQELQTLAWAVSNLVLERRGRFLGHPLDQPYPEPTEADLCCDFHTEDYARRKRQHDALREQLQYTTELSRKMAHLADDTPEDVSDSPIIVALHSALLELGDDLAASLLIRDQTGILKNQIEPLIDDLTRRC